jgi:hypothetical protein
LSWPGKLLGFLAEALFTVDKPGNIIDWDVNTDLCIIASPVLLDEISLAVKTWKGPPKKNLTYLVKSR